MNLMRKKPKSLKPSASAARSGTTKKEQSHPLESLEKILHEKKREITQEIEAQLGHQFSEELQRRIDSALDEGDQSILDLTEDIDLSLLEMRNKTLKDIHGALRSLKNGTYGICEECQGSIPERRLMAMPSARTCVTCQEKREILEKVEKAEERFK